MTSKRSCEPAVVKTLRITQRVIAADGNQDVETEELEVVENLLSDIVDILCIRITQVRRERRARQVTRPRARRMQECATEPSPPIHHCLGQLLHMVAIVGLGIGHHIHQSAPATANPDHLVPFPTRPYRDGSYRGVQPGDVAASRQDAQVHALSP